MAITDWPAAERDAYRNARPYSHAVFDGFGQAHPNHPSIAASREGGLQALGAMIHAALSAWAEDAIPGVPERWNEFGAGLPGYRLISMRCSMRCFPIWQAGRRGLDGRVQGLRVLLWNWQICRGIRPARLLVDSRLRSKVGSLANSPQGVPRRRRTKLDRWCCFWRAAFRCS